MTATTYGQYSATPLAPLVDEQRVGSAGGQALVGVAGIVLAIVLIVGQISLATAKGIAVHVHATAEHITAANDVTESIITRAAPSVELEKVLDKQAASLANTRDAMVQTNVELDAMATTTDTLLGTVGGMRGSSAGLASDVATISSNTTKMSSLLDELPGLASSTHKRLTAMATDTDAINTEMGAIAGKMEKYGLPQAKGAPTG